MKNKLFNKRFSKILVALCLLLTMVLGSSMSVSAEVSNGTLIYLHSSRYGYKGRYIKSIVSDSPVYSVLVKSSSQYRYGFVSASSFSAQVVQSIDTDDTSVLDKASTDDLVVYNSFNVYNSIYDYTGSFSDLDRFSDFDIYLDFTSSADQSASSIIKYIGNLLGVYDYTDSDVVVEAPGLSPIPSNPEYDSSATAMIAPPSGVTYYEYVDTSQTSATSPTVRKGQLQWNAPDDDSLYIEIYADLIYKEGLFNKKTQVVYPWKTLTNSALKADTHKLLFDRFQAGTDYFVENGLDESAFSSHVVNGYYLRFCKINEDKSVSYSLWNKISIYRDNSLTQIGTASSETGIFDENGNWVNKQIVNSEIVDGGGKLPAFSPGLDDDGNNLPSNNNGLDLDSFLTDSNIFERFIGYLKSAMSSLGELPQYVGQLFSFLPQEIIGLLGFGVIIAIILRIIGR